jgi:hypothetical protein
MSEADVLCAFVNATNINSKRSEWSCGNTANKCSWSGIYCDGTGSITEISIFTQPQSSNYPIYTHNYYTFLIDFLIIFLDGPSGFNIFFNP